MSFPTDPRPMLYELQVGATDWANITPYVHSLRQTTGISRGVPSEYSQADPSVCSFSINNAGDLFSPRNPSSPLYGKIGKNTPVRVSIAEGARGLVTTDNGDGSAWTPDSAATSITGDLDVRVDLEILTGSTDTWASGTFDLASKYDNSDTQRSWLMRVNNGKVELFWWPLGTVASQRSAVSVSSIPAPTIGRRAIRATLQVVNGSNCTATFYTAPTISGPWTVLGAPVSASPTTSIFDGTAGTRIGAAGQGMRSGTPKASYYKLEVRSGISGTVVASPDPSAAQLDPVPFASGSFTDAQGNTWTPIGSADAARVWYGTVDTRFYGETSSFPNRWDTSGNDAWVPITAAGMLRRLGQNQEPAQTGLQAWVQGQSPQPVSYFPLTGREGTSYSVNQGRVGRNGFKFYPTNWPYLAAASGNPGLLPAFTYGKDWGVPWLDTGMEYNASGDITFMQAEVGTSDDNFTLDFVFQSPVISSDSGVQDTNIGVLGIYVWTYDNDRWYLQLQKPGNDGTLQVTWYANDGVGSTTFPSAGPVAALLDNQLHTCRFELSTSGTNQTYSVYIDGVLISSNTMAAGRRINGTSVYQMFYSRYVGQTVFNLGHLTGWSGPTFPNAPAVASFSAAALGYVGETAGDRMVRISALGGIPFSLQGSAADTETMGAQYSEPRLTQLRDAENTDRGYLLEPRSTFGLKYRTRVSMVAQSPGLTLNYAAGHIVPPFEPTDDDLLIKNDMTVSRRDGGSARVQLTTGRMSILEPPDGVGQYADQTSVNCQTDAQLDGIAAWIVNLGTVDQARYPSVSVDLGNLAVYDAANGTTLDKQARALDTGDLLVITGLTALGVYDDVRLLVLGVASEEISEGGYQHRITWNCAPYTGYEGSVYATSASVGTARYDTAGSTLVAALNTTATTFQVAATATSQGTTLWTTDPAAFPLDITMDGERMTVGAISGTSSPQTFSNVTRSVNGVVKSHSAGTKLCLQTPAKYS